MRRVLILLLLLWPVSASGQSVFEAAGSRALGMAGAFVAVADDATAVYWNPAGLVAGRPAGMTIGWVDFRTGDPNGLPVPGADHRTSKFVSLGTWPVGVSYGHFQDVAVIDRPDGSRVAESLKTAQYGLTLLQTVTPGLVVGSTIKYVRGSVTSMPVTGTSAHEALDQAAKLEGDSSGRLDLDVGAMADMGKVRVGLTVRNLRESRFVDPAGFVTVLHRAARMGVAVRPTNGLTLAIDMDLDTVDLRDGPRRILAVGGEDKIGRRWALRGGVRWSLKGPQRRVAAVGASIALRPNFWLDSHYTQGKIDADRGLGFALRAGF